MPVERDLAFVVAEDARAGDILKAALGADRALIANADVFDVYRGPGLPEGHKSVAISVTLQPRERTLTDAEIEAVGRQNRRRGRQEDRRDVAAVGDSTMRLRVPSRRRPRHSADRGAGAREGQSRLREIRRAARLQRLPGQARAARRRRSRAIAPPDDDVGAKRARGGGEALRGKRGRARMEFDESGKRGDQAD